MEQADPRDHECLSCRRGTTQVVDHDRHAIRMPSRFRGPPSSGNGGVAAGIITCIGAAHLDEPVRRSQVRLHRPPPLEHDLPYTVETRDDGVVAIEVVDRSDPDNPLVVLTGWASSTAEPVMSEDTFDLLAGCVELDDTQSATLAAHVERPSISSDDFRGCFVCGPDAEGGLRLRPGPIGGDVGWLRWDPETDWIEPGDATVGLVPAIAALDCTSAVGLHETDLLADDEAVLLGTYDAELRAPLPDPSSDGLRIITRPKGREGRKVYTDIGLFSPDGTALVLGLGTWIVVSADTAAGRA